MSVINNPDTLVQITDHIWLSRVKPDIETPQELNVCYRLENGEFVALDRISIKRDGTYFKKDKVLGKIDSKSYMEYFEKLEGIQTSRTTPVPIDDIPDNELFEITCNTYRDTKSIKNTAKILGISEQKARRILITKGLYTCEPLQKINALLFEGVALSDIGEQLGMSVKQIRTYLPYDKKMEI